MSIKIHETLYLLFPLLILSCKTSEKLHQVDLSSLKEQSQSILRERITEPAMSFIEIPLLCPELITGKPEEKNKALSYQLKSGKADIKAEIIGHTLRLQTQSEGSKITDNQTKESKEQIRYIYRDKVKTLRIPYIPKWVWALLVFNVIYFGWTYKSLFVRLLSKLL